jgi:hypothetical protein
VFDELLTQLAGFSSDPLGFVYFAFPWGEGELKEFDGPELWQIKLLKDLGDGVINVAEAVQIARTSGHGIGKSACVSWIILWAVSTFEDTMGVVTANTETQLKTKTWSQLAKWFRLFVGRELFEMTATALYSKDPLHEKTWRVDMVPWSERNTEAFAGLHNQGKRLLVVFDEASAIPDVIWEVTEGALSDAGTQRIWLTFGNPTRNKGRFRECFTSGKFAHRWKSEAIDSRTVRFTDKVQLAKWVQDYGEDSDFVRIRVRGVFPRIDAVSFIAYEDAVKAAARPLPEPRGDPIVLGVDVGRFGTDASVIIPRQGFDARSRPVELYPQLDTMTFAAKVVQAYNRYSARIAFIDEGGVGGGVVDRCRQLGITVIGVDFGSSADNFETRGDKYANKRAEIWGLLRAWLINGGCLPSEGVIPGQDITLIDELIGPTYGLNASEAIQLESKKDMMKRGVPSPNVADALACSFAYPVYTPLAYGTVLEQHYNLIEDYNPYSSERMNA